MKRHESLSLLSSDHHKGLSMAKLLKSAGSLPASEVDGIYSKFKFFFESELAEHFSEEESILVPPLSRNVLIKRMCEEHRVMKEMFSLLHSGENSGTALSELGAFLERHIRFEEKELFPMIENTLSEEALLVIKDKVKSRRSSS